MTSLVPPGGYPPATRGLLVVWGQLAASPFGGMTWQVLHHLAGFRRLGYDVWYVEDADQLQSPDGLDYAWSLDGNLAFLRAQMASVGLADRFLFRAQYLDAQWYGGDGRTTADRLHADADAVFNLCGTRWADDSRPLPPRLVYLETDPGDMQVTVAHGYELGLRHLQQHRRLYTYGQNVGRPEFPVPVAPLTWRPTVPPVVLDWWQDAGPPRDRAFTTISQWKAIEKPNLWWDGVEFEWRKDVLFRGVLDLPSRTTVPLELALRHVGTDRAELEAAGWRVTEAERLDEPGAYRDYVRRSAGEFTVAKDQYTRLRTGWFSDRSACYLAAGRPVVTQSTGFEAHLPTGLGLLAFDGVEQAAAALDRVAADPAGHAAAALEIAREHFAHDRVLPGLLEEAASCA